MDKVPLPQAILSGYHAARLQGSWFSPTLPSLLHKLTGTEKTAGTIILPDGADNDYKLVNIPAHRVPKTESTAEELWKCVKKHYGLNAATAFLSAGAIPIYKPWLNYPVIGNASRFTVLASHIGVQFFPGKLLRMGTPVARGAKAAFGSIRVFGILGRANVVGFIGFAIFDIITLAACMKKN